MQEQLENIVKKLESLKCPEHNQTPNIFVRSEGIQHSCCCEKFGERISELVSDSFEEQIEDEIDNMFF